MRLLLAALGAGMILFGASCDSSDSSCKDDFDCEGALVCKVSTGSCEPFVCKADSDCDTGQTCADNACQ